MSEGEGKEISTLGSIPISLQGLFDRDPLSLTRPEKNHIIDELRRQRVQFASAEGEARAQGKRVNAKKAIADPNKPKGLSISLADLLKDI